MKIRVNGAWRDTTAALLSTALADLGYGEAVVATAVNGEFVPVDRRPATRLAEGDQIEILAPIQGG